MHPLILQNLASERARDMRLAACAARSARRVRRARRGYQPAAAASAVVGCGPAVRHA